MTHRIGLTLGDPSGIGPELWIRTLLSLRDTPDQLAQLTMFGDPQVLRFAAQNMGLESAWRTLADSIHIEAVSNFSPSEIEPGKPSQKSGISQISYLHAAIAAAQRGDISGLCTGPIHKASAKAAGFAFPGHTELLAQALGDPTRSVVMMLAGPTLRVALCTIHIALSQVPSTLTAAGIAATIRTTALALCEDFGETKPALSVVGLNPHAGEAGHFGDEEARLIVPAMEQTRLDPDFVACGATIVGPLVPDVAFRDAVHPRKGQPRPAALVAMYHDQGLIPLKLLDFDEAVNVTLGLQIVRTSPDHGTAHDIAGKGIARPDSLQAAIKMCLSHTAQRRKKPRLALS